MEFNFEIKNFGKIDRANLDIKPLTIIAGKNDSGKSFATKSLYSFLSVLNIDYLSLVINSQLIKLQDNFNSLQTILTTQSKDDKIFIDTFLQHLEKIDKLLTISKERSLIKQFSWQEAEQNIILEAEQILDNYKIKQSNKIIKYKKLENNLNEIKENLSSLQKNLHSPRDLISFEIGKNLRDKLLKNFQITKLKDLHNFNSKNNENNSFKLNTIGDIVITGEEIQFNLKSNGIEEIQKLSSIIYLDSPIYIKIKEALEECNKTTFLSIFAKKSEDKYLKGYPFYVEKLFELMKQRYIDKPDFIEVYKKIEKIISGKVEFSKSGEINYVNDGGKVIPISLTAMGISNIGLIGLLLENNIIKKGSFLILDEPEVHLHPEWQIKMIEVLYDIAKSGANIVIATHSIEIIKFLEILSKKDKEAAKFISLNMMPYSDEFHKKELSKKIDIVLEELSEPFFELYMKDV